MTTVYTLRSNNFKNWLIKGRKKLGKNNTFKDRACKLVYLQVILFFVIKHD